MVYGEEEKGNRGPFIGLHLKMRGNEGKRGEQVCGEAESEGGNWTCVGMKKRWKGKRAGVLYGQLRGRRNRREKVGIGEKGVLVLWSSLWGCNG